MLKQAKDNKSETDNWNSTGRHEIMVDFACSRNAHVQMSCRTHKNRMEVKIALLITKNLKVNFPARVHAQLRNAHHTNRTTWKKYLVHFCIYTKLYVIVVDPSGRKGSVSDGLGADISLPHCLATGIRNLVPKATSGPKSRGPSFGTTLWRHVQRYCAHFRAFMVIYVNLMLWVFCS